jgi:cytoskeleton protein RodZ
VSHRENDAEQELQAGLASVGATLRTAREEQERSLESVAADLHLQLEIVRAIETGDEGKLPAATFLRGYVRSYARLLSLDDASLIARLPVRDEYRPAPLKRVGTRRSAVSLPRGKWLLWGLALAGLTVMIIYGVPAVERLWSGRDSAPASDQLQLPLAQSEESAESAEALPVPAPEPEPEHPPSEERIEVEAEAVADAQAGAVAVPEQDSVVEKPADEPTQTQPVAVQEDDEKSSDTQAARSPAAGPAVIRMRFLEDSWVEMEANGRKLVVGTQPAGSERTVRAEPPIQVLIGNAPGVELTYRGEAVDIISQQRGKVLRVTLDD